MSGSLVPASVRAATPPSLCRLRSVPGPSPGVGLASLSPVPRSRDRAQPHTGPGAGILPEAQLSGHRDGCPLAREAKHLPPPTLGHVPDPVAAGSASAGSASADGRLAVGGFAHGRPLALPTHLSWLFSCPRRRKCPAALSTLMVWCRAFAHRWAKRPLLFPVDTGDGNPVERWPTPGRRATRPHLRSRARSSLARGPRQRRVAAGRGSCALRRDCARPREPCASGSAWPPCPARPRGRPPRLPPTQAPSQRCLAHPA